jgi:hypothetical protein
MVPLIWFAYGLEIMCIVNGISNYETIFVSNEGKRGGQIEVDLL